MARIPGIERKDAPWHLRWFYDAAERLFGKPLTATKVQMHAPKVVWAGILMDGVLGRKRRVSLRYIQLGKIRAAARIGCPF